MPKKSKRQKIIADLRRHARQTQSLHVTPAPVAAQPSGSTFQFRATISQHIGENPIDINAAELTAIKRDLGKTLLLSACAIGAELGLYWLR
ncbi:hypothetical protein A2363_02425 [Candidatus Gottesmanbacteria bacterium RIFOXYB1_FULL_47_11]|uniref:Uncharacterized protein n=1 Tax=Candidatus Gottesmanbacteria bacterium RIFOXYB1_FULL_47_11 TaxID=1798401 RepID=A0A1F6BE82_9BACT|nr:MAG: hypothetical protein A2363_02425 [Candidatus Gottesmanbacteria bacterium RIFOXYB1_FULL_47_11]